MVKSKFLPMANPDVGNAEAQAAYKVIKSGWISMGNIVKKFEKEIENLLKVKHAIFVNNGTSALHCTLLALRIDSGDEVIVPTLSYISSANAILYCGAKPVFCDSDPKTFNVNKSLLFRILNINHILDRKIIKGNNFIIIAGIKIPVSIKGSNILTLIFLKNSISSNKFTIIPKQ